MLGQHFTGMLPFPVSYIDDLFEDCSRIFNFRKSYCMPWYAILMGIKCLNQKATLSILWI